MFHWKIFMHPHMHAIQIPQPMELQLVISFGCLGREVCRCSPFLFRWEIIIHEDLLENFNFSFGRAFNCDHEKKINFSIEFLFVFPLLFLF